MKMQFPNNRYKALTLSYDDGVIYDKKLIEIMTENNIKGTFNINSELFNDDINDRRMSIKEAVNLYTNSGMEVAVHGCKHLFLNELTDEEIIKEIYCDRLNLEKLFPNQIIKGMAYAYGKYDDRIIDIIKHCGIVYSRITSITEDFEIPNNWLKLKPTCHHNHPELMDFAEKFVNSKKKKAQIFYIWGHSYEFNDQNKWDVIENFCKYIGNKDDIWYATNIEIYNYINAYNSLILSADCKTIFNPTSTTIYYSINGDDNNVIIPGETKRI